MKRISFIKHGMELHIAHIEGEHKHGDPVPVPLVKAGMEEWKSRMGWDYDGHVAPGPVWDQVRIGAQTFSADQYLRAEKQTPPTTTAAFTTSTKATPDAAKEAPREFKAPDKVPDWDLVDIQPTQRKLSDFNALRQKIMPPAHLKITPQGEIDYAATNEAGLKEALRKIGAKPRPPKPDSL